MAAPGRCLGTDCLRRASYPEQSSAVNLDSVESVSIAILVGRMGAFAGHPNARDLRRPCSGCRLF